MEVFKRHKWWEALETLSQLLLTRYGMIFVENFAVICCRVLMSLWYWLSKYKNDYISCLKRVRDILLCTILMITKRWVLFFSNYISTYEPALHKEWWNVGGISFLSYFVFTWACLSYVYYVLTLCLDNWGINWADCIVPQNPVKGDVK